MAKPWRQIVEEAHGSIDVAGYERGAGIFQWNGRGSHRCAGCFRLEKRKQFWQQNRLSYVICVNGETSRCCARIERLVRGETGDQHVKRFARSNPKTLTIRCRLKARRRAHE